MKKRLSPRQALKLAREYQSRLIAQIQAPVRVILFGSQARGEADADSDVDLLVILPALEKSVFDAALGVAWEVGFEHNCVIAAIPTTEGELVRMSASPFFQAVQREGLST